jgi:hypothetical protein
VGGSCYARTVTGISHLILMNSGLLFSSPPPPISAPILKGVVCKGTDRWDF